MNDGPQIGDIVAAVFPERQPPGREQEGIRPSVVVGLPDQLGPGRYPLIVLVPFTSFRGQAWVRAAPARYPQFAAGAGGLRSASVALLDQIVAMDVTRIRRRQGSLTTDEYRAVQQGLEQLFKVSGAV